MSAKNYVAGFMFNQAKDVVVLIEKLRPEWQRDRFNAVGGHIEKGETPAEAMSREFFEETGVLYPSDSWRQFADLLCPNGDRVYFFTIAADNLYAVKAMTDEQVRLVLVASVKQEEGCVWYNYTFPTISHHSEKKPMYNVPWLVHMAIEALRTGYHYVVEERRPKS